MSKETATRVASSFKYKGIHDRMRLVHWLHGIQGKVTNYEKRLILQSTKKDDFLLWVEGQGIKIL